MNPIVDVLSRVEVEIPAWRMDRIKNDVPEDIKKWEIRNGSYGHQITYPDGEKNWATVQKQQNGEYQAEIGSTVGLHGYTVFVGRFTNPEEAVKETHKAWIQCHKARHSGTRIETYFDNGKGQGIITSMGQVRTKEPKPKGQDMSM